MLHLTFARQARPFHALLTSFSMVNTNKNSRQTHQMQSLSMLTIQQYRLQVEVETV